MRLVGLLEYNAHFVQNLAEIMAPLTYLCGDVPFHWTKVCDLALAQIKEAVALDATLTCIREEDLAPQSSDPIHLESAPKDGDE